MIASPARYCMLLLALAGLLACAQAAPPPALRVGDATAAPESVVRIDVVATNAAEVGALDLSLRFDPKVLRFREITAGRAASGALIEANEIRSGQVLLALASSEGLGAEGSLCSLVFDVGGGTGSRSPVSIESAKAYHRERLINLPLATTDGEVQVRSRLPLLPLMVGIAASALVALILLWWAGVRRRRRTGR